MFIKDVEIYIFDSEINAKLSILPLLNLDDISYIGLKEKAHINNGSTIWFYNVKLSGGFRSIDITTRSFDRIMEALYWDPLKEMNSYILKEKERLGLDDLK